MIEHKRSFTKYAKSTGEMEERRSAYLRKTAMNGKIQDIFTRLLASIRCHIKQP